MKSHKKSQTYPSEKQDKKTTTEVKKKKEAEKQKLPNPTTLFIFLLRRIRVFNPLPPFTSRKLLLIHSTIFLIINFNYSLSLAFFLLAY